jgi:hypothetical protein
LEGSLSSKEGESTEFQSEYTSHKIEVLHRNILRYKQMFERPSFELRLPSAAAFTGRAEDSIVDDTFASVEPSDFLCSFVLRSSALARGRRPT